MGARLEPEAVFLEHVGWIEAVAARVCRRNGVWGDDADDFIASARARMIENDYAVIRKFRGDAGWKTYLASVVVLHFREFMRERIGRWRPSAAAEARGQLAKELEAMVYRDGCTLSEAGERLRTMGRTTLSDAGLGRLLAALPVRHPPSPRNAGAEPLEQLPARRGADERLLEGENDAARARMLAVLYEVLEQLAPEDRVLVRMSLADGRSVAGAARALRLPQKPLYRRLSRLALLRTKMESAGVTWACVREEVEHSADASWPFWRSSRRPSLDELESRGDWPFHPKADRHR